jgi:hypothetical protein
MDDHRRQYKEVKISELKPGSVQHESLPPEMLETLKLLYDSVGRYMDPTREQWELGFMRDANPGREMATWSKIAFAWREYHLRYTGGDRLGEVEEKQIVGFLVMLSMGVANVPESKLPETTKQRLHSCYLNAANNTESEDTSYD